MGVNVAVVGATGLVGTTLLGVLEERGFPVDELTPLASARSAGQTLTFQGRTALVQEARPEAFINQDFVFFAATGSLSKALAPAAAAAGALVIDKSSTWRMHAGVPLVVPEINPITARPEGGIVSCPNCTTIGLVMALEPLRRLSPMTRVIVTSFQAVSGTGKDAVLEMEDQLRLGASAPKPTVYGHNIADNVLPYAEGFLESSYSTEELKLQNETRKILSVPDLGVTMTCCRVPVRVGHSLSVLVEFEEAISPEAARRALRAFPGVRVQDRPEALDLPTPLGVAGQDDVVVGRIRTDLTNPKALWLWIVSDNLRKGASVNAVQIAEQIIGAGVVG